MNFTNRYYLLRHGNSLANKKNLIVSNPDIGINEYGLSEEGKLSIRENSEKVDKKRYIIYSSPFKRTRETAEIFAETMGVDTIEFSFQLRERYFGEFDLQDSSNYESVWEIDAENPNHKKWKVESVKEVVLRVKDLLNSLEGKYSDRDIVLVSHGDALQITETIFKNIGPELHRTLKPLEQGEFRPVNL